MRGRPSPVGAVARGLLAGAAGTAVMTAWQLAAARLQSSGAGSGSAEQQPDDPWEQASAPAKVGKRILEGVFQQEVGPDKIGLLTNVMHWGYGTSWGAAYGLLAGSRGAGAPLRRGLAFGTGVWGASYAQLVPMGLYEPPWKYPPKELALDLSYHLAYGAGTGLTFRALRRG